MRKGMLMLVLVAIMLCSCKSAERSEVRHVAMKHDTVYVAKGAVDSVIIKELKYVDRARDTVLIREDRVLYKTKYRNDTVYVSRRDSVPYPVYVEKKVAYVPFVVKVLCGVGILTLLLLLIWLVRKGRGL